jgi:hypothetical protein
MWPTCSPAPRPGNGSAPQHADALSISILARVSKRKVVLFKKTRDGISSLVGEQDILWRMQMTLLHRQILRKTLLWYRGTSTSSQKNTYTTAKASEALSGSSIQLRKPRS